MFDELYAADVENGLRDRALRPLPNHEPQPGIGAGFWSAAAKALPAAGVESFRAMSPLLDAYGKAAAYRDAPTVAMIHGQPEKSPENIKRETIDRIGDNDLGRSLRPVVERLTPDPATTGAAGQFVFGAGKVVGKAVGYSMLTGPVAGAALTGADEGTNEAMRLMDKGVDQKTAAKAGAVHGIATSVSVALPVAGKTIAQTAGLAVVGGPASYMAETATIRHLLENADYDKLAREYDPFDTTGLLVSLAAPSVMGAGAHAMRARTASGNRGIVRTAAERAGISPDIAQMIASIETGGSFSATAANRKSTARGLYQFLDSTWRDYGGTEGNRFDATTQADIGARFIRDNIAGLTKTLGRDPAPHEVYLSHLLGQKGAAHVLQADAGRPLADVVAEYDAKNAARIVADNGMKDMTVGQAVEKWKATSAKHLPQGYRPEAPRADQAPSPIDADTEASTRVLLASMHARGASLVPDADLGDMARHIDGIEDARSLIDAGQPVDVASRVGVEQGRLGDAYDRVLTSPAGDAFDPLVHVRPDDIEGVVVSRGGWKGIGDAEVKGAGHGLVKFIWRHGEMSKKPPELQVTREDILAFPEIIRRFDPAEEAMPDGSRGRAWRVQRTGPDGSTRTVLYADNRINGRPDSHLVSVHVLSEDNAVSAVLSKEKTDWGPESPGKRLQAHTGDPAPGFLHQTGQDQSVNPNIAHPQFSAADRLRLGNGGNDITEALTKAGEIFNSLRASGKGIDAFFADKANLEGLTPETNNLLIALSENADNPTRMAELLARYVDNAVKPESAGAKPADLLADAVESMRSDPAPKQRAGADSIEQRAAVQAITENPNLKIRLDDGSEIDARQALLDADAEIAQANTDAEGFMAAVTCFLRH